MQQDVIVRLKELLKSIAEERDEGFSGLGIVVWDRTTELPIFQMCDQVIDGLPSGGLKGQLVTLSREDCVLHDGFHIVDLNLQLLASSVYFSPPVVSRTSIEGQHVQHGGRYFAALFGSYIPGVACTAVLSSRYGPYVFVEGVSV